MFSDANNVAVIILKIEQNDFTMKKCVYKLQMELQAVKTLIDLGLHSLHKPVCRKT